MDINKLDLTFLIDKEKAIQVKMEVVDEYYGFEILLSPEEKSKYLKMIAQLNVLIENLK